MLNNFKLIGWRKLAILNFLDADFVFKNLIDPLWRQWIAKLPIMP